MMEAMEIRRKVLGQSKRAGLKSGSIDRNIRWANLKKAIRIKKKHQVCDFFCVFFWLFVEKSVPLQRFCNILIINGYFRFCDICATSGANALIVS